MHTGTSSGTSTYDTACRMSYHRSMTTNSARPVCKHGAKCYRRNPQHLLDEAHPADPDYLSCCRHNNHAPEFISIRKLFEWCDISGGGKATRDEVNKIWELLQSMGEGIGDLTDELWQQMDDDGNGHINFSEFAEFTTSKNVGLPLGLDDLIHTNDQANLRCGVFECKCVCFRTVRSQRRRCKYGESCYQTSLEHREQFAHPDDEDLTDWEANVRSRPDLDMCECQHKKKLHASPYIGAAAVAYPKYWTSMTDISDVKDFNELVPVSPEYIELFQTLFQITYSDVTTRDRVNHCKTWKVPRSFKVLGAKRNENSRLWRKYIVRKAELQKEVELFRTCDGELRKECPPIEIYSNVETTKAFQDLASDADTLDEEINEWYLFHGTSSSAAENICKTDFKMRLAGSATGTLYGRGAYLAESITKADEYAKDEKSCFTVMLCRVLGGRVKYTDERTPDPEKLTEACVQGPYDCILGDRKKVSKTYREFIVFDTENIYPEYTIEYQRGEFFKSPSHP